MSMPHEFDPEYAAAAEWAREYRRLGLQVVPCYSPSQVAKGKAWKRPLFREWTEFQDALVPDAAFDRWYGKQGEYIANLNMGVICGRASDNLFVIDLDIHKYRSALDWWLGLLAVHNNSLVLSTAEQKTGGGGIQKLFRAPPGWHCPTNRTPHGVDVRGQGGFAVLAPSMHESGRNYEWLPGHAPWDDDGIAMAPAWLLEEVEKLVAAHGGDAGRQGPRLVRTASPGGDFNDFGHQHDGREEKMRDLIWGAVVDWYRECPIKPGATEQQLKATAKYLVYEGLVVPRTKDPAKTKTQLLEQEGRGPSEFWVKWQAAMRHWDDKVAAEAARPGAEQRKADYTDEFAKQHEKVDPDTGEPLPLLLTAEQFCRGFRPPDYMVHGMLQRSYLISLTARTGHGKTAIAMYLGQCIARGLPFHGRATRQGSVLFLAGENPDDIRARYLALADHEGFDVEKIPFYFVDGVINIQASLARIQEEAAKIPNLSLVVVDTQAAYFLGDEGNSNEQQAWFARLLRELIKLPGKPAVLVNCHPVKNATQDNLVPMGGSAFLNEVDANLTLWAEDRTCTLGPHSDKWRGASFESVAFELRAVTCDALKDTEGHPIPAVVAVPITEAGAERREAVREDDDKTVLRLIHADKQISFAGIARRAGFMLASGEPAKAKVQRIVERLKISKLVYKFWNSKYRLTKKGCRVIGVKQEVDDDGE